MEEELKERIRFLEARITELQERGTELVLENRRYKKLLEMPSICEIPECLNRADIEAVYTYLLSGDVKKFRVCISHTP